MAEARVMAPYLPAEDSRRRWGCWDEYWRREVWKKRRAVLWRDVWVALRRAEVVEVRVALVKAWANWRVVEAMLMC